MALKTRSLYLFFGLFLIFFGLDLLWYSIRSISSWTPSWTVVVDEEFVIPPAHDMEICKSFPNDTVLTIYVNVSGGDRVIDFLIRDEEVYYSKSGVSETTIEWKPPPDREICFVYINKDLSTSKTVHTMIMRELYYTSGGGAILLPIGVTMIVAGIAVLVVYRRRSRS